MILRDIGGNKPAAMPQQKGQTMTRTEIEPGMLRLNVHHIWAEQWMVLTAGDFRKAHFNSMAVGWGSIGTMWGKPFVQVVVRPVRYTYEFMEKYDTFTLCAFPENCRKAVALLGSKSGRDGDKIKSSGLTPIRSAKVAAPGFDEAELILECRKMYYDDVDPTRFADASIQSNYPKRDYHRVYFGEILAAFGTVSFRR